jgi:radical SAM superfamily enzyme YgiQ (UPF0313 family)
MTICLVTAPTVTEFRGPEELSSSSVKWAASQPQLGILSLAAVLEHRGDDFRIVNLNRVYCDYLKAAGDADPDDFAEAAALEIGVQAADVYGFGSICSSYPLTLRIARALKAIRPASAILLGGPQASVVDVHTLAAFPFIDFVLRGEAERSLPALIDQRKGELRLDQVPGLTYRVGTQPRRNADAKSIENLDDLPPPAYHLTGELQGATMAALELGRGCPYACTFCSTNDFFRRNFRLRSPQRLLLDMRWIAKEYGIREFDLVHDMFTVDRRRVVAFCEAMIESGEHFSWSCSARTDSVDGELLEMMARGGCAGIFYGVEVGSPRMQKIINKNLDPHRAKDVIDDTERLGMRSTVSLITGFPEETWDDLRHTVRIYMHSARCPHSSPQLNILAPLAETPIHAKHKQAMVLDDLCSDMSHQGRSQNEADLELIRDYPDIFPNFYLLPTPHLDRDSILELREFALNTLERFRWLVIAIDQSTSGIEDFFVEWRTHRLAMQRGIKGSDLRHYYRTSEFHTDFQIFVHQHSAAKHPAVEALLDFEDAVRESAFADRSEKPSGSRVAPQSGLRWNDISVKKEGTILIDFSHDIQTVIQGLRLSSESALSPDRRFYVMREVSAGIDGVERVSHWLASALRHSDGRHSIREIVQQLALDIPEVGESLREYTFVRLLEEAHAKGFIEIFRPCPEKESTRAPSSASAFLAPKAN